MYICVMCTMCTYIYYIYIWLCLFCICIQCCSSVLELATSPWSKPSLTSDSIFSMPLPMSLQDVLDAWDRVRTDLSGVCDCAECTDTRIPRQVLAEALSQHLDIKQWHGSRIRGYRIARSEALVISFFIREWRLLRCAAVGRKQTRVSHVPPQH